MSENRDKPAEDPDATVTIKRADLAKPDEDATVMMKSRDALKAPDEDITVTMSRTDLLSRNDPKAPDEDATVMMSARALKEPDDDATVMIPPGGLKAPEAATPPAAFRTDADPDVTVTGVQPPPSLDIAAAPSRMPMIAGGLVVVAVILYFVFSGGQSPTPVVQKTEPPATAAQKAEAPAPAAPAAPAAAPAASSAAPAAPALAAAAASAPAPAAAGASVRLKELLAADVKRGAVAVSDEAGGASITIAGSSQFASGGVDPEAKIRPLLLSIAAALDKVPGSIVVIGHADAKPSTHPKFPSNQELSAARASSAAQLMAPRLSDPKRLTSQGASDTQQVAPSDTPENRAKNRRVVIVLKPAS